MEQQLRSGQELTVAEVTSWTAGWDAIQERIGPCFAHSEQRHQARARRCRYQRHQTRIWPSCN